MPRFDFSKWFNVMITVAVGATVLETIVGSMYQGSGLIGCEIERPHRQTYLEYVKERLEVERLMK